jgi:TusA-related sulfurtransferase
MLRYPLLSLVPLISNIMLKQIDLSCYQCPRSLIEAKLAIKSMGQGDSIQIIGINKQLFDDLTKIKHLLEFSITYSDNQLDIKKL